MFSYTDEAIVTSSPTGRHLSTVIRALPGVPTDLWRQHAEAVCKVLNELRPTDSIAAALQVCGNFHDEVQFQFVPFSTDCPLSTEKGAKDRRRAVLDELATSGIAQVRISEQYGREARARNPVETCALLERRIESLEHELADAHEKLKERVELSHLQLRCMLSAPIGAKIGFNNRTFKIVE